jgi:hypothetical protein
MVVPPLTVGGDAHIDLDLYCELFFDFLYQLNRCHCHGPTALAMTRLLGVLRRKKLPTGQFQYTIFIRNKQLQKGYSSFAQKKRKKTTKFRKRFAFCDLAWYTICAEMANM